LLDNESNPNSARLSEVSMRRLIPVIAALILMVSALPASAQNQQILDALKALNGMPERFGTPAQAETTARAFFEMVQSTSGNENAIEVLKRVKRAVPQAEWNEGCRRAENLLMHTVQQTLDGTIVETIQARAGGKTLGSIHGYGYSGKWPIKPETQLTFDGDFDASFFGTELADTSPDKGGQGGRLRDLCGQAMGHPPVHDAALPHRPGDGTARQHHGNPRCPLCRDAASPSQQALSRSLRERQAP
jgi:hypothetical protein